ncbi:hypothetical protein JS278_00013 [Acidipropionibacterium virtanenii]|uniref:Uncharacterized protein n=1 Tax=Acidipropionibacterium virtanenii TaxID=2057246 RepID=A0A344UPL4_9ACTN|nr:hypothetical protein JS278_00013 [Acidipropionibacterium virtanenii]
MESFPKVNHRTSGVVKEVLGSHVGSYADERTRIPLNGVFRLHRAGTPR